MKPWLFAWFAIVCMGCGVIEAEDSGSGSSGLDPDQWFLRYFAPDNFFGVVQIESTDTNGDIQALSTYTYQNNNRVTREQISERVGDSLTLTGVKTNSYNERGRVLNHTEFDGNGNTQIEVVNTYDESGNHTNQVTTAFSAGTKTSVTTVTFDEYERETMTKVEQLNTDGEVSQELETTCVFEDSGVNSPFACTTTEDGTKTLQLNYTTKERTTTAFDGDEEATIETTTFSETYLNFELDVKESYTDGTKKREKVCEISGKTYQCTEIFYGADGEKTSEGETKGTIEKFNLDGFVYKVTISVAFASTTSFTSYTAGEATFESKIDQVFNDQLLLTERTVATESSLTETDATDKTTFTYDMDGRRPLEENTERTAGDGDPNVVKTTYDYGDQ